MTKLTKRTADLAAADDKVAVIWDEELRGFGVRVWPSGRKIYLAMTRVKGRLRKITIAPHGPITAEKARVRAHEIISEAKTGAIPPRNRTKPARRRL